MTGSWVNKAIIVFLIFMTVLTSGYRKPHKYTIQAEKDAYYHNNVGLNYLKDRIYYAAIQEFKIAISLSPSTQASAIFYNNLGETYNFIGYPDMAKDCFEDASRYALIRKHLEEEKKLVEAITIYEEKLSSFAGWCQQLLAETQGKKGKGILPIINQNTTNLHSIGQYLQEGRNIVFETVLTVNNTEDIYLDKYHMTMNELNNLVAEQVSIAHKLGNTPSIKISLEELSPTEIGRLIYFYEMAAAIGGYLLDINPFDQPGVEDYKRLVNEEINQVRNS